MLPDMTGRVAKSAGNESRLVMAVAGNVRTGGSDGCLDGPRVIVVLLDGRARVTEGNNKGLGSD